MWLGLFKTFRQHLRDLVILANEKDGGVYQKCRNDTCF